MNVKKVFFAWKVSVLTASFFLCSWLAMAQSYTIEDLGTLGGNASVAQGINNIGQVVGNSTGATGRTSAFRYSDDVGMEEIDSMNFAMAINNSGHVVGWSSTRIMGYPTDCALLWTGSAVRRIYPFCTSGLVSHAYGINDSGQAAVCAGSVSCSQSFRFEPDGRLINLTPSNQRSQPNGINAKGHVVGRATFTGRTHAFRYTDEGGLEDLGTLGGDTSEANAINDNGQVVGESATDGGRTHAFRYTDEDGLEDLGTLPGHSDSSASAINADGTVIGCAYMMGQGSRAVVYTDDAGLQDLNGLIDDPGWVLREATGINDLGQIVGSGLHDGAVRAYRLTPVP